MNAIILPFLLLILLFVPSQVKAQAPQNSGIMPMNSTERLRLINVDARVVLFKGREGIRVEKEARTDESNITETMVLIENSDFRNGTIELELAGEPAPDAGIGARGFVGVAFRIDRADHSNYECIYLRPVNGRAENQLQRNHTVQYVSHPEYPWR